MKKPLILIVGRTATGKDTLVKALKRKRFSQVKSYTTRPRRKHEGDTHVFIRTEEVSNISDIMFRTDVGEYTYFTTHKLLDKGDAFVVDPVGVEQILADTQFTRPYVVIYLEEPYEVRKQRFIARDGSSQQDFQVREDVEKERFDEFEQRFEKNAVNNDHIYSFFSCDTNYIASVISNKKTLKEWNQSNYPNIGKL